MSEGKRVKIATMNGVRYGVIHPRSIERRSFIEVVNDFRAKHQTATAVIGILIISACILLGGLVEGARMAF